MGVASNARKEKRPRRRLERRTDTVPATATAPNLQAGLGSGKQREPEEILNELRHASAGRSQGSGPAERSPLGLSETLCPTGDVEGVAQTGATMPLIKALQRRGVEAALEEVMGDLAPAG